jgi:hypothetical protein
MLLGGGILLTQWVSVMKTKGIFGIDDFKRASFEKKCDVVTTQSNYIVTRTLGNCKVYLYHIWIASFPTRKKFLSARWGSTSVRNCKRTFTNTVNDELQFAHTTQGIQGGIH